MGKDHRERERGGGGEQERERELFCCFLDYLILSPQCIKCISRTDLPREYIETEVADHVASLENNFINSRGHG